MDFQPILDIVFQQGIWCALFVWLFYDSRKRSEERETKLYSIIIDQKNILGQISNSLILMDERIGKLEESILGGKGND